MERVLSWKDSEVAKTFSFDQSEREQCDQKGREGLRHGFRRSWSRGREHGCVAQFNRSSAEKVNSSSSIIVLERTIATSVLAPDTEGTANFFRAEWRWKEVFLPLRTVKVLKMIASGRSRIVIQWNTSSWKNYFKKTCHDEVRFNMSPLYREEGWYNRYTEKIFVQIKGRTPWLCKMERG